jgi:uncharacterized protein (DUF1778 family)
MSNTMRVETRTDEANYDILKRASDLLGMSLSSFMLSSAIEKATKTIKERDLIILSSRDQSKFIEEMLNPKPMNDTLLKALDKYEETFANGNNKA